ncbi:hypothetical protein [Salinibaculum rarum]|uniref:hypothetical protein n=1 Tax=Salinibaculum rarum TaxID=3058903 RepID=UPI00265DC131|nr:hypothetical protein [Salinibaculum sp. KK48]
MQTAKHSAPTPAEETLDLALVSSSLAALITTYALIAWVGLNSIPAIIAIITFDMFVVFLVVPHAIAYWLNRDIDKLLTGDTHPCYDPADE